MVFIVSQTHTRYVISNPIILANIILRMSQLSKLATSCQSWRPDSSWNSPYTLKYTNMSMEGMAH